ncbi:MAG: CusA/CzcA family heavy metal efflux RND transporter [Nitrospinae bacterium CG11_big_fil_rev_8_21_14_0_20_45_15]|nr:MAG: CusA/CzcA family heavy metal efflux RND transporter [Nitrospinae bacterium CG11_big_fil_rev_8_21_14_0_20_45_15]
MIAKVIGFSLKNRFLILLSAALIVASGIYALKKTPLDAIPDLSDVQVIVFANYPGQAPQIVEDQVTYPLTTAMLSVPRAKTVRGYSFFGLSFVYVIFEDGTDLYWARSRVLELLNFVSGRLPKEVQPTLGPDATGVGWVYEYALTDKTGRLDLAELRSLQDWFLKYELQTVPGVSEVASVGGYVKQYQIEVDPNKLFAYGIPLEKIVHAVKRSNRDVGGRVLEMAETEFMVRGRGYVESIEDIESIPLGVNAKGTPLLLKDVAYVHLGPEMRRGLVDLNGEGEVVGGVALMRFGENALDVINGVKQKLKELQSGLPEGVEIVPVYDRSGLILRAVENLKEKLIEEFIVVGLVCAVFLFHIRSSLVAMSVIPVGILMAFLVMHFQGLNANIMSLGGIAIAIGAMIDGAIVMIENVHKHMEREQGKKNHWQIVYEACSEVGPALFFSLLIITVSFLPIFTLEAQEGRLFAPLAFTKTYAMASAAFLSITLTPVLIALFVRGKILPEKRNPINLLLTFLYKPILYLALRMKTLIILSAFVLLFIAWTLLTRMGSEFMPPLDEGDLLYMPTTLPGISITEARDLLQRTDRIIKQIPEVKRVFGKAGRAETATDSAPLSMFETIILLHPKEQWRPGLSVEDLKRELDAAINIPGVTNAWTMPIKTRLDMLSTGIKTPVGIKIAGNDLDALQALGKKIEGIVRDIPGTSSVYAERVAGGNYLDFNINRLEAARFGLTVGDIQDVIETAIGGKNISTTVEGLERYPINLRYSREFRNNLPVLRRTLIPAPGGEQIPMAQVASIEIKKGPPAIKSENARLNAWIYIDIRDIDVGTYVENAKQIVEREVSLPSGVSLTWSGQYEYMQRAKERLKIAAPLTLFVIFLLLYLNFKKISESLLILLSLPLSTVGGVGLVYCLGYDLSVAVAVGFIALSGVAAEIGVLVLVYIDQAYQRNLQEGSIRNVADLRRTVIEGAVGRVRPIMMTMTAITLGLAPIMWGEGTGSQVMQRIAAPMIGGMISATLLGLIVLPAAYAIVLKHRMKKIWRRQKLEDERAQQLKLKGFLA